MKNLQKYYTKPKRKKRKKSETRPVIGSVNRVDKKHGLLGNQGPKTILFGHVSG